MQIEQHELFEKAQRRIVSKKRLYYHFICFILLGTFAWFFNEKIGYGIQILQHWWLYFVSLWGFLFLLHTINVFITEPFLGKDWERQQREKLITIQKQRIEKIQKEVEKLYPLPEVEKTKI